MKNTNLKKTLKIPSGYFVKHLRTITVIITFVIALSACNDAAKENQSFKNSASYAEVAAQFNNPPVDYSLTFYWGWEGKMTEEVIARDLDEFKAHGVHIVTLESGYDMGSPYLSPEWLDLVKKTVEMAKERDMRVWIVDEGKYPSGFAGGKFTTDAPELRMKALVVDEPIEVEGGTIFSKKLSDVYVSAVAVNKEDGTNQILEIIDGEINWKATIGKWEVLLVKHDFRSSPTRAVNNQTRGKDASNSLLDYLDPAATQKFIEFTHEEHKKRVGSEFGTTVLGFRGDEPDYSIRGIPWTTAIFDKFKKRKGYDVTPFTASFFIENPTEGQKRIKADYYDVWSDMFGDAFFKQQADWCAENNLQYLVHLNKEDDMMVLVNHEGDFFKCMRSVQMPGVDAIWNQIWPGKITDFPKYASSVSHVYGKPRSFTESFAAYKTLPTVEQAKWVLDQQLVRGINMVEVMFIPASTSGKSGMKGWTGSDEFPEVAKYVQRASYLLSQGEPTAKVAVYLPTTSLWLGDKKADSVSVQLMQHLLEAQRDFDYVDEYALTTAMSLEEGAFINLSGQGYSTVIIPSAYVISQQALNRLKSFASSGGKVIAMGDLPSLVADKTFRDAKSPGDLSWILQEPSGQLTEKVLAALPVPDVKLDITNPDIKYIHRKLADADMYFFFNESTEPQTTIAELEGSGKIEEWNALSGNMKDIDVVSSANGNTKLELNFDRYETKFILIK